MVQWQIHTFPDYCLLFQYDNKCQPECSYSDLTSMIVTNPQLPFHTPYFYKKLTLFCNKLLDCKYWLKELLTDLKLTFYTLPTLNKSNFFELKTILYSDGYEDKYSNKSKLFDIF